MSVDKEMMFEIPLLNNINDLISMSNTELQLYLDVFHGDNAHDPYTIKHLIINLTNCMELLIKFRLLEEHWAFIFEDVNKANKESLDSGNFKSVSFNAGIERLENLCGIKKSNYFTKFQKLYIFRNKAVHFTLTENLKIITTTILDSITEIKKFLHNEIIPYIQNPDAIEGISNDLNELLELQTDLRTVVAKLCSEKPNNIV